MKVKGITIQVHPKFFNNFFEKERKRLEKIKGVPITQVKLTEILASGSIKVKLPKVQRISKKFVPRGIGGFF
jgi:hypothetical protein